MNNKITSKYSYICSAILRLPSNLFYDCSLLTRSKDSSPHPDAPYPLVFVCSSLERAQSNKSSWNEAEAKMTLKIAEKYLESWPGRWGKFSPEQVCFMARTHQQVSFIYVCWLHRTNSGL